MGVALDEAVALGVEHFSVYILEVHPGTRLERRLARGEVRLLPDAATERLYLAVIEHLAGHGIVQYEVANFARPGAESRHNRNYWRHRPWLALGPGAHGYWGRRRYANPDDLPTWLAALEAGRLPAGSIDELDRPALRLERLILALRTAEGVRIDRLPPGALDLARGLTHETRHVTALKILPSEARLAEVEAAAAQLREVLAQLGAEGMGRLVLRADTASIVAATLLNDRLGRFTSPKE